LSALAKILLLILLTVSPALCWAGEAAPSGASISSVSSVSSVENQAGGQSQTGVQNQAGFVAVLDNGFSIHFHHSSPGQNTTRLFFSAEGSNFIDIPNGSIVETRKEEPRPVPAAPEGASVSVDQAVSGASDRYLVDADLIRSVIMAESGFDPNAVSQKGAQGLMQLMPGTASELGVEDALNPGSNVDGGTRYLRQLLEQYHGDMVKALAAYNAGPGAVDHYQGTPPYPETRAYVARVIREFNRKKAEQNRRKKKADASLKREQKEPKESKQSKESGGRTHTPAPLS